MLENNLKDIKIIEGSFKVTRSFALVSLFFFKSLEEIQNSDEKEFSVTVMENDNLQKLFPRKVKVDTILVHLYLRYFKFYLIGFKVNHFPQIQQKNLSLNKYYLISLN